MCQMFAGQDPARYESRHPPLAAERPVDQHPAGTRLLGHRRPDGGEGWVSTPAFLSKLHSEVLEQHGEATNFTSLLRCACTIHLGELDQVPQPMGRIAA